MPNKLTEKFKAFLLWSQRYTHTDMLYLMKGGFWLTIGQFAGSGLVLVLTIAFAHFLPKETYGAYRYVMSIAGILLIATLPAMATAVTQSVARGFEGALLRTIRPRLVWGSLATFAGLALAGWYAAHGNMTLAGAFAVTGLLLPFYAVSNQYDAFLTGKKLFADSVAHAVALQSASAAALIAAAVVSKNLVVLVAVSFGVRTLVNLGLFHRVLKVYKPNDAQDPEAASYGKHMSLMGAISTVAASLDSILAFHFVGGAELAIYAIAIGPPDQIKAVLANLDTLVFPNFAKRDSKEIRAGMPGKFLNLFLLSVAIVGAYVLAAPFLYHLVFPKYEASVLYSQIFALGMLNMAFFPAATYLRAKKKIREQYLTNILSSVFQIAAMLVGVVSWGLLGLVVARVLSRFVSMLITLYYYYRTRFDTDEASPPPVPAA